MARYSISISHGTGVSSTTIYYTYNGTQYSTIGPNTVSADSGTYVYVYPTPESGYTSPYTFYDNNSGSSWIYPDDNTISSYGSRNVTISATRKTFYYYYQVKYLNSNGTQIGSSNVIGVSSNASSGYNVSVTDISAPSGWYKSGTYTAGQYCSYANGYFTIVPISTHQTTTTSYAVFNVYVTQITYTLTMKLRTENGTEIGTATATDIIAGSYISPISGWGEKYNPNSNDYEYSSCTNASGTVITSVTVNSNMTINFYYKYKLYYGQLSFSVNGGSWSDGTTANKTKDGQSYNSTVGIIIPDGADYVPKRSKYTFGGWKKSGGTDPAVYHAGDTVSFTSSSHDSSNRTVQNMSAYWIDARVKYFWWDLSTGSSDSSLIYTGGKVSNITAARWNSLLAKIDELSVKLDIPFSYANVLSNITFYASDFNKARNGINAIKTALGAGTPLCEQVSKDDEIKAEYFIGLSSLRNCLNTLIDIYNDRLK